MVNSRSKSTPSSAAQSNKKPKAFAVVCSINASLLPVFMDAGAGGDWTVSDDEESDSHSQQIIRVLDEDQPWHGKLKVGNTKALWMTLEGETGEAEVYRLDDGTLAVVEPPRSWWDDDDNFEDKDHEIAALFAEVLSTPDQAKKVTTLELPSGKLVVFDSNVDVAAARKKIEATLKPGAHRALEDDGGVVIALDAKQITVLRRVFKPKWSDGQQLVVAYIRSGA